MNWVRKVKSVTFSQHNIHILCKILNLQSEKDFFVQSIRTKNAPDVQMPVQKVVVMTKLCFSL